MPSGLLTLTKEAALQLRRLFPGIIGATQFYATTAGLGVTTEFTPNAVALCNGLLPFVSTRRTPNTFPHLHSSLPPILGSSGGCGLSVFHYALLAKYMEACSTPRYGPYKASWGPQDQSLRHLGPLTTAYGSIMRPTDTFVGKKDLVKVQTTGMAQLEPRKFATSIAEFCPVSGSIESCQSSHRKEFDITMTLWDTMRQPLSTVLLTGPSTPQSSATRGLSFPKVINYEELKKSCSVPHRQLEDWWSQENAARLDEESPGTFHSNSPFNIVISDCAHRSTDQRWHLFAGFNPQIKEADNTDIEPWQVQTLFYQCAKEIVSRIHPKMFEGSTLHSPKRPEFILVSYNTQIRSSSPNGLPAEEYGIPLSFQSGVPILVETLSEVELFPTFKTKLWDHTIGLPLLCGEPCVMIRLRGTQLVPRQKQAVVQTGTYFFTWLE